MGFKRIWAWASSRTISVATIAGIGTLAAAVLPFAAGLGHNLRPTTSVTYRKIFPYSLSQAPMSVAALPTAVSNQRICAAETRSSTMPSLPSSPEAVHGPILTQTPLDGLKAVWQSSELKAFAQIPWPNIHPRAQLARVPILMYHDVLDEPQVFFDLTPADLETHLQVLRTHGFQAVSLDQVVRHLRTGQPLPEKPVLLTFDDGYEGHYTNVYPLLKRYGAPAVFSVFPAKLDGDIVGRSTLTWEQLQEMAADPLITIAAHSVTHPADLRRLADADLMREVAVSKAALEEKLGISIQYFTYPAGYYDDRVMAAVREAGYQAALTMRHTNEKLAGESESLLAIERLGQSNLNRLLDLAWGGPPAPIVGDRQFNFITPVATHEFELEGIPLAMVIGGRPVTVHADSRYQVYEILARTNGIAAVDGGFFSLKYLDSNVMVGPVLSQSTRTFVPGNASENPLLIGRPLVLISHDKVRFVPFEPIRHNTLAGIQQDLATVTDAFVAAAWLVKDGIPQPEDSFGNLFDFEASRHRAYWGINYAGQPVVGVTKGRVDSITLGGLLAQLGLRDAVMLDSGASTSLAYRGESMMHFEPRPVPHIVALIPPHQANGLCPLIFREHTDRY